LIFLQSCAFNGFMENPSDALQDAIEKAGGAGELARKLGIKPQAISQWEKVPPLRVLEVERATGVPRHRLRPDLYPIEPIPPQATASA
jgi:DNA-binding transcriptional regulator YdaS (Cro superfamily)